MLMLVPYVIESTSKGERGYDIFSRLLKDRIIMLTGQVDDTTASVIVSQLLYLESQDPAKGIALYINSPGGSVTAGLAIYDTMNFIKPDVSTICVGMAASMSAFLLAAGANGKRYALASSEVMLHQPLGGTQGQASDIKIHAERILRMRNQLNQRLVKLTGQPLEVIERDTDRDYFLTAEEARAYGLVDQVLEKRLAV